MTGEVFHIELQARDPERNRWRFYRIEAGRDLFGDWVVKLTYGRIGARGQTKTHVAPASGGGNRPPGGSASLTKSGRNLTPIVGWILEAAIPSSLRNKPLQN
jgi:hypothetical protein